MPEPEPSAPPSEPPPRVPFLIGLPTRYAAAFVRSPIRFALCAVLLIALAALGLTRLDFSSDNRSFFGTDNPDVARLEAMAETYSGTGGMTYLVRFHDGDVFTKDRLTALAAMTGDAAALPGVLAANALTSHVDARLQDGEVVIEPLVADPMTLDSVDIAAIRDAALAAPELVNRSVSASGDAVAVTMTLARFGDDLSSSDVLRAAEEFRDLWRANWPDADVYLTGALVADATFNQAARRDLFRLVPMVAATSAIVLALGVGSLAGVVGALGAAFAGTVASLGFAGWVGIAITPGTAISPLASMVLITASAVHVIVHFRRTRDEGMAKAGAVERALAENFGPVAVTSVTTVIGFLCMNFADSPPLQQMGNLVAAGLCVGWVGTIVLLPLALLRLPDIQIRRLRVSDKAMAALADWVAARSSRLIISFLCITLLAGVGLSRLGSNDIFHRYFDQSFEYRRAADASQQALGGVDTLLFSFEVDKGTIFDPDALQTMDEFAIWLRGQPSVASVISLSDLLARLNGVFGSGDGLPDSADAAAQLILLYELSLGEGQSLGALLDSERTQTRVVATVGFDASAELQALAARADRWGAENAPLLMGPATGVALAFAAQTRRNNLAMVTGMFAVLLLVSAIMVLALRSLRFGALSLIPNVLPALLAFGVWGLIWKDVNLGSSVVTTMTFGIVVDDTVHLMMHFLRHRRSGGLSAQAALRQTFQSVGVAVLITSTAIVVGFGLLATSGFAINAHIGALTALVVGIALVTDLLLLGPLLVRLGRNGS